MAAYVRRRLVGALAAAAGRGRHTTKRELRGPIRIQETIGFLIGVGELRIAKAGEQTKRVESAEESLVTLCEGVPGLRPRIPPCFVTTRQPDAAKLGQHDRLFELPITLKHQHPAARPLSFE